MFPVPGVLPAPTFIVNSGFVTVTWQAPNPLPGVILRYDLINDATASNPAGTIVYSGTGTNITLPLQSVLTFQVRAVTSAGAGPYSAAPQATTSVSNSAISFISGNIYVPIVAALLLLLLIVLLLILLFILRRRRNKTVTTFKSLTIDAPIADSWDYDAANLTVHNKIKVGQFTTIYAGSAINIRPDLPGVTKVVIKRLNPNAPLEERQKLIEEANLLKKFSKQWHAGVRFNLQLLPDHYFHRCPFLNFCFSLFLSISLF